MPLDPPGLPEWAAVLAECEHLQLSTLPSELHGSLSGWLAGGGKGQDGWLQEVMVDAHIPNPARDSPLGRLFETTQRQLEDPDFTFTLLLPDPDAPLFDRSQALFAWCRGFVGGFGLAVGDRLMLSEQGQDALADLVQLAAEDGQAEGDEEDELALVELEEFVRVATLLLRSEYVPTAPPRSLH